MTFLIYLSVLTTAVIAQVTASCPAECNCPADPLICPPGVSTVSDGCGCCKVCAAQLNQNCSPMRPCDHHKGLECNYGNDVTMAWGICRAKLEGRTCEYNGRMYQNGESFRAGCKHQCACIDSAVGCAPLCTNKLPPVSPSCPYPRLVRIPGQCCFSVDCQKGIVHLSPMHQVPPPQQQQQQHRPAPHHTENELVLANKFTGIKPGGWESEHGYKHLPVWNHLKEKCLVQTTDWSQCSRSCGMGISSRITNKNPQCKMEKETRICTIRPCHALPVPAKKGKRCSPTHKAPEPVRLSYGDCVSVRLYRPNYCGVCTDGRCCSPRRTRTLLVTFVCPDGEHFQRSTMFIQSCKCSDDCGHLNDVALPPQHWMYGDTHKFVD
ncbi:CCN family member 1-like [Mastacembelus armatus]|uniref:CCN family member 1-like n=1 Tax=Mastacembelus armatus TaxID=205130 RepID=A0A3Q3KKN2_9TELE|nr:CCN family member 1-like [Mastacembelus armatus]